MPTLSAVQGTHKPVSAQNTGTGELVVCAGAGAVLAACSGLRTCHLSTENRDRYQLSSQVRKQKNQGIGRMHKAGVADCP